MRKMAKNHTTRPYRPCVPGMTCRIMTLPNLLGSWHKRPVPASPAIPVPLAEPIPESTAARPAPSSASAREEEMAAVIFTEKVWMAKVMPLALMPDLYWPYSAQSGVNMKARMPTMLMGMVRTQVSVRNSARFS